jgi:hypothetical protein
MGFYGNHIVPRLTHLAMRNDLLTPYRRRVLSAASGRVLEIGIGSGVNLQEAADTPAPLTPAPM